MDEQPMDVKREPWWRMWWPFPWIDPLTNASDLVKKTSSEAAARHPAPLLPELPYTEADPRSQALWSHISAGQIRPDKLWRMRRTDLGCIAGHLNPHPDLTSHVATKLHANANRALQEIERRNFVWSVGLAAGFGGLVAGVIVAVAS